MNNRKCLFDQHITDRDKLNVKNTIAWSKDLTKTAEDIGGKSALAKLYITAVFLGGIASTSARLIFSVVLRVFSKDEELQSTYYEGVIDGQKRRPFKHYNTKKRKCAYETGRVSGESLINGKR